MLINPCGFTLNQPRGTPSTVKRTRSPTCAPFRPSVRNQKLQCTDHRRVSDDLSNKKQLQGLFPQTIQKQKMLLLQTFFVSVNTHKQYTNQRWDCSSVFFLRSPRNLWELALCFESTKAGPTLTCHVSLTRRPGPGKYCCVVGRVSGVPCHKKKKKDGLGQWEPMGETAKGHLLQKNKKKTSFRGVSLGSSTKKPGAAESKLSFRAMSRKVKRLCL